MSKAKPKAYKVARGMTALKARQQDYHLESQVVHDNFSIDGTPGDLQMDYWRQRNDQRMWLTHVWSNEFAISEWYRGKRQTFPKYS